MCPGSRKKRSLPSHVGFFGSYTRNSENKTFTKSAPPIAPPGCPDFAFSTIDAAKIRILSAALFITLTSFILLIKLFLSAKIRIFPLLTWIYPEKFTF